MVDFIFYHTPIFYLTQSVWRDEAFSYFMAKPNILQVIINTANDFNPPVYYLLLHFWMKIAGHGDEGLRLLSFIAHVGSVYIAYLFASKAMSKKFAAFVGIFFFLNPMLLYYGFEMRMYSFYVLFTIASYYFLYFRKWKWYTIVSAIGLYTHSFFPLIIVSFLICFWFSKQLNKKTAFLMLKPMIYYLPWLPILSMQFLNSKNSWLFPVDLQLITSALGNLFTNYEGTPANLWGYHALLSLIIILFMTIAFIKNRRKSLLAIFPIIFPLAVILGFSVLKRPIFVNRYMIFVTVFELISISWGIWSIRNKHIRYLMIFSWIIFSIYINIAFPSSHKKTDFKTAFAEINSLAKSEDYVYAKTPIGFLESVYYSKQPEKVFVYNPLGISIPNYIGVNIVFPNISRNTLPPAPSRTYMVEDNADYYLVINK